MERSCYYIGHREADERLRPVLTETKKQIITK